MQTSEGSTRLRSIDALRGAAALAVVLYHAAGRPPADGGDGVAAALGGAVRFAAGYGYVGVFLFFVISGFCIHLNYAKARASGRDERIEFLPFMSRRAARLRGVDADALSAPAAAALAAKVGAAEMSR